MTDTSVGAAMPVSRPLSKYERKAFVELARRMSRMEIINLLEDDVWMTTMPRAEKMELLRKPEVNRA